MLIILGRETLHDIADAPVDLGYKKTIPLVLGDNFARVASASALIVGCVCAIIVSPISILGSLFILWGLKDVLKDPRVVSVRKSVDVGLGLLVLGLVFFSG